MATDRARVDLTLLRGDRAVARWRLESGPQGPLATADGVARLVLLARRGAYEVALDGADPELLELLDLLGLAPTWRDGRLRVEMRGEPEDGEQGGIDEVVVADDPVT